MSKTGPTCTKPVYEPGLWAHPHPCGRKAIGEHGFCGIHSPEAQAKRDAKGRAKWDAHIDAEHEKWRKLGSFDDTLAALKTFPNPAPNCEPLSCAAILRLAVVALRDEGHMTLAAEVQALAASQAAAIAKAESKP